MKTTVQRLIIAILIVSGLFITSPAYAFNLFPWGQKNEAPKDTRNEKRDEKQNIFQDRKEDREEVRNKMASASPVVKQSKFWGFIAMAMGKVTAKDGTSLTIEKNSKSYTILTDEKTQFRRLFWGKSSLDEIQIGDTVHVFGRWTDEAKTSILARSIRDVSIQKRFGVFFGVIQSLTSNGWVMTTISSKRDNQTVTLSSSTKLTNRKGETVTQADIAVGHRVRVKGLWDRTNNTLTDVTIVKDFSLPPVPVAVTPTPTATPAPTATVTPTETPASP